MQSQILPVLWLITLLPASGQADIFRCRGSAGEARFSQVPCGGRIDPVTPGRASWIDGAAMKQRSLDQLQRLQQLPSPTLPRPVQAPSSGLGYAQRAKLRQLEIEADGLRRDLDRAGPKRRKRLQRELDETAKELRSLRKQAR